ncbi:MAG: hypothetical protein LUD01_06000 [Clostridiales bacterium]|nr:hypothetical protein [Clostridiales bacterium]MCD8217585.1 hypothetical protein [Clostridiales bacterium]
MSDKQNKNPEDGCDYLGQSASATEQTGLIPSAPLERSEIEAYRMMYPYPPPLVKKEDDHAK